jgi:hypothetical protein
MNSWATSDIDRCKALKTVSNEYNYCMGQAMLTVSYCENIKNLDLRTHCILAITKKQRQVLSNSTK